MRKEIFWITLSCLIAAAVYLASGIICDAVNTSGKDGRIIPIYCVDTEDKSVALTFDAAWRSDDTDAIINALNEYDAPSTFFVTGDWAERFPEDVKKLYDAGHDIANHSYAHPHIDNMSYEELYEDTKKCNNKIKEITGVSPLLYRGPYGEYNNTLIKMLQDNKMYYIQWDVDSLDWMDPEPSQLIKNVTEKVDNGSIVLLHVGAKDTASALPEILKTLKKNGYNFVKVRDMIYTDNYEIDHTGRQKNCK